MMSMGSLFGDDDDDYVDIDSKIEGNTVECPLCSKKISEAQANSHIDECLNLVAINELQDINKGPIAPPVVSKQPIDPPNQKKVISHGNLYRDLYINTSSDDDDSDDDSGGSDEEGKLTLANFFDNEIPKSQLKECPNSANPFHECSQYCKDKYQNIEKKIEKNGEKEKGEIKIGNHKEIKEEKREKGEVSLRLKECPNIINPYHSCSNYCIKRYQNNNNNNKINVNVDDSNKNNNNNSDDNNGKNNDKLDQILDEAMKDINLINIPPKKIDKSGEGEGEGEEDSVDILPLFSDIIDKKGGLKKEDSDDDDGDDDDNDLYSKIDYNQLKKSGEILNFVRKLLTKKISLEEIPKSKEENEFENNNNNNNNNNDNNDKKEEAAVIPVPPPAPPVLLSFSNSSNDNNNDNNDDNEPINNEDRYSSLRKSLDKLYNKNNNEEKNKNEFNPADFSYNYNDKSSPNPSSYSSPYSGYYSNYNYNYKAEDNNKINYSLYNSNEQQKNENENPFSVQCPYSNDCKLMEAKEFPSHVIENHMDFFSHAFACPICLLVDDKEITKKEKSVQEEFNIAIQQNTMNLLNHLFEFHPEMLNFDEQSNEQQNQVPIEPPPVQIPTKIGDSIVEQTLTTRMEKECQICFETFEVGSKVAWMECFCVFHSHCISSWNDVKSQKGHCPVHSE